ncbi:MAG: diaminopimelate epimerase [Acidobacteriota bacterium]
MSAAAGLPFWKMEGAGNDFVVLDGRVALPADPGTLARRLCPRRTAIGADGLLVVAPERAGVRVLYRNADGSPAGFCGNGARCAALFAREVLGIGGAGFELAFPEIRVGAEIAGAAVTIVLGAPRVETEAVVVRLDGTRAEGRIVHAGVPHVVAAAGAAPGLPLAAWRDGLAAVRPDLARDANVTLVEPAGRRELRVRTLERGAGETAACGSGALAAAAWARETGIAGDGPVTVVPPSGIALRVALDGERARLSGPARFVYSGRTAEAFT